MDKDTFDLQVLARGSYIDNATGDGDAYLVEAITVRLNHVALNAWGLSAVMNCRECYKSGEAGDAQWQEYLARQKARREAWEMEVMAALGIDPDAGSVKTTQALSEVFVVVHIRRLNK